MYPAEYTVIRTKNRFAAGYNAYDSSGYRDYQALVTVDGGWIIEIQVIPREMWRVKSELGAATTPGAADITGHGAYKEYRAIREARARLGRQGQPSSIRMSLPIVQIHSTDYSNLEHKVADTGPSDEANENDYEFEYEIGRTNLAPTAAFNPDGLVRHAAPIEEHILARVQ